MKNLMLASILCLTTFSLFAQSVEDKKAIVAIVADMAEILTPYYIVLFAEDGLSGERMAIEHIPNVILSDVMMPKRDGYELCKFLKSNVITNHIPVILLTAKAGQENKMSGLTYGADAYMAKPFESDELLIRMNNFIQARNKIWDQFKSIGGLLAEDLSLNSIDDQFFQKIQSEIQDNISNEQFSVEDLAKAVGFSRSQLHRKLKAVVNKSANQLIRETRLHRAKSILDKKSMPVSEVAYAVGYSNLSYFTKSFKDNFGYVLSDLK